MLEEVGRLKPHRPPASWNRDDSRNVPARYFREIFSVAAAIEAIKDGTGLAPAVRPGSRRSPRPSEQRQLVPRARRRPELTDVEWRPPAEAVAPASLGEPVGEQLGERTFSCKAAAEA